MVVDGCHVDFRSRTSVVSVAARAWWYGGLRTALAIRIPGVDLEVLVERFRGLVVARS